MYPMMKMKLIYYDWSNHMVCDKNQKAQQCG